MDWSKAKTILIITLLLLNVFLFAMIVFTNSEGLFHNDYNRYAKAYLESRDIKINSELPTYLRPSGKIMYTSKEYDPHDLCEIVFDVTIPISYVGGDFFIEKEEESINLSDYLLIIKDKLSDGTELYNNSEKLLPRLIKYLEALDYDKKSLVPGEIEEVDDTKQITFLIKYKKNFVFDHEITVKLSKEGLLTLRLPTQKISKGNGAREILSAHQILVMAGLPEGSLIDSVDFGYKQISEGDIYGNPVWRITLTNQAVLYYNAYTGVKL